MTPAPIQPQPRCSRTPCRTGQFPPISATTARTNNTIERATATGQSLETHAHNMGDRGAAAPGARAGTPGAAAGGVAVASGAAGPSERSDQQTNRGSAGAVHRCWCSTPVAYRRRNVVERCFNRLEQYRAIATC